MLNSQRIHSNRGSHYPCRTNCRTWDLPNALCRYDYCCISLAATALFPPRLHPTHCSSEHPLLQQFPTFENKPKTYRRDAVATNRTDPTATLLAAMRPPRKLDTADMLSPVGERLPPIPPETRRLVLGGEERGGERRQASQTAVRFTLRSSCAKQAACSMASAKLSSLVIATWYRGASIRQQLEDWTPTSEVSK